MKAWLVDEVKVMATGPSKIRQKLPWYGCVCHVLSFCCFSFCIGGKTKAKKRVSPWPFFEPFLKKNINISIYAQSIYFVFIIFKLKLSAIIIERVYISCSI